MSMVSYFLHRGKILVHPWVAYFQTNPLWYPSTKLRRCRWHGPPQCSTGCGTLSRHAVERGQAHGRSDLGWTKCPEPWDIRSLEVGFPDPQNTVGLASGNQTRCAEKSPETIPLLPFANCDFQLSYAHWFQPKDLDHGRGQHRALWRRSPEHFKVSRTG